MIVCCGTGVFSRVCCFPALVEEVESLAVEVVESLVVEVVETALQRDWVDVFRCFLAFVRVLVGRPEVGFSSMVESMGFVVS